MFTYLPNNSNKSPKYIQQPNSRPPRISVGIRLKNEVIDAVDAPVSVLLVSIVLTAKVVVASDGTF